MDYYTASGFIITGAVGVAFGAKWGFVASLAVGVLALVSTLL